MRNKKIKGFVVTLITAVMIALTFSVVAMADNIAVSNGVVTGLDSSITYKCAEIHLANYSTAINLNNATEYKGVDKIEGLGVGLWIIQNTSTGEKKVVWIEGDEKARSVITNFDEETGRVKLDEYDEEKKVNKNIGKFVLGTWTAGSYAGRVLIPVEEGINAQYGTNWKYNVSVSGYHIDGGTAEAIINGTIEKSYATTKLSSAVFKYAYVQEDIIPVDELHTMTYMTGVRQSSLGIKVPDGEKLYSGYVLYTINDKGELKSYTYDKAEAVFPAERTGSQIAYDNIQKIDIKTAFPEAEGYVVGLDIYPYYKFPQTVDFTIEKYTVEDKYVNTCLFVQYLPEGYVTDYKESIIPLPYQYNGANISYIEGRGDGTFDPDGDLTIAEASTILAKLKSKNNIVVGLSSRFEDITPSDWYYNAIAYLENCGVFDYKTDDKIYPNTAITRGELAEMIARAGKFEGESESFSDVYENHVHYEAICALYENGVVAGYPDGKFEPDNPISRAEAVTMFNFAVNLKADKYSVVQDYVSTAFSDVDEGHWAEDQIYLASTENAPTPSFDKSTKGEDLIDNGDTISFKTKHIEIFLDKNTGKVSNIKNLETKKDINDYTLTPWFVYINNENGRNIFPEKVDIVNGRLHFTFLNEIEAYFIVETYDNYFTVELDSELPKSVAQINFCNLLVSEPYSQDDDSYRLSCVTMNTNTVPNQYPSGVARATLGVSYTAYPRTIGAKLGVAFSKASEQREHLIEITDAIDKSVGITSKFGGANSFEVPEVRKDYGVVFPHEEDGISVDNIDDYIAHAKEMNVDVIDIHPGIGHFPHGEYDFQLARTSDDDTSAPITASKLYERIVEPMNDAGIGAGLHTYSTLLSLKSSYTLKNTDYLSQLVTLEGQTYTLKSKLDVRNYNWIGSVTSGDKITINESLTAALPLYVLVDEEIISIDSITSGKINVTRAIAGTTEASHEAGAELKVLQIYGGAYLVPIPGSELFYHIAEETAKAYNEGGFEFIFLDGLESSWRVEWGTSIERDYWLSEFVRAVVAGCEKPPVLECSTIAPTLWAARSRAGTYDWAGQSMKDFNTTHVENLKTHLEHYLVGNTGWYYFTPDNGIDETKRNITMETMHRNELDHLGSLMIAYDFINSPNPFNLRYSENYPEMSASLSYFSLYTRLRKANYFDESVLEALRNSKYEHKLEKVTDDGTLTTWAFKEMSYTEHVVGDYSYTDNLSATATNPFSTAQTPFVRIEQRFSVSTEATGKLVFDVGAYDKDTATNNDKVNVTELVGKNHSITSMNLSQGIKLKVVGNGSETDAIALFLGASSTNYRSYLIPLNFEGEREIILVESDYMNSEGYVFDTSSYSGTGIDFNITKGQLDRDLTNINFVRFEICGNCENVQIGDIYSYAHDTAQYVENPAVKMNGNTLTFKTTLYPGEFVEYYPEFNKAYKTYFVGNRLYVKEVAFTKGTGFVAPTGDEFTYTYSAKNNSTTTPMRAKVVIGMRGDLIENTTPRTISVPSGIEQVTIIPE